MSDLASGRAVRVGGLGRRRAYCSRGECANVSLTFCDNVNWAVDAEKRARADNIESMIQMR